MSPSTVTASRARSRGLELAAWLLATGASATAQPTAQTIQLEHGGQKRTATLHSAAPADLPRPLVIALHGFGGSGAGILQQGRWAEKARAEGFIVVAPDGVAADPLRPPRFADNPRSWNAGPATGSPAARRGVDDVGFIAALIDRLVAEHRADPTRVYVTGFSNGAAMAWRVGLELAPRVAAIAPVANSMLTPAQPLARPVPLLLIWGEADPLNPIEGGRVWRQGVDLPRPSGESSWRDWAGLLGCTGAVQTERRAEKVQVLRFADCRGGSSATFIRIAGLGHQWPGGELALPGLSGPGSPALDATDVIWRFFSGQRLPSSPPAR